LLRYWLLLALNVLPLRVVPSQKPQGQVQVALHVAIERDLARPPENSSKALCEKMLGRRRYYNPEGAENPPSCRIYRRPDRETATKH
jgi:transposase